MNLQAFLMGDNCWCSYYPLTIRNHKPKQDSNYFVIGWKDEQEWRTRWLPIPCIGHPIPQLKLHGWPIEFPVVPLLHVAYKQPIPLLESDN